MDVIVIGSRGMSGAERLIFGSTAERVVRHARTPVLVVPPQWTPANPDAPDLSNIGPVVVGVDFTDSSFDAAVAGCRLAEGFGTCAELTHVVPELRVLDRWRAHADQALAERIETARRELDAMTPRLPTVECARTHVEVGDVAERLAAVAACEGQRRPILVLGRQAGRRGAPPGALAYQLLTICAAPVLTCVPDEE